MPRKRNQKKQRQHKHHPIVKPAPFLYKERVVLQDIATVQGNPSGTIATIVNANGYSVIAPASSVDLVPQQRLWDQYAGMYDFYQVKGIHFQWIPFRFQGQTSNATDTIATLWPSFTIIDPDNVFAQSAGGAFGESFLYSFGNCKSELPYREHRRSICDYTNLGISKQDSIILKTNGSFAAREKYTGPASIAFLTTAPSFSAKLTGQVVWKIEYEFSGRKAPGLQVPEPQSSVMPLPVKQPDTTDVEVQRQIQRLQTLLVTKE